MVFGWIKKLRGGLSKSSKKITGGIKKIFKSKKIDDSTLEELEDLLISSDLGVNFSSKIIYELRKSKLMAVIWVNSMDRLKLQEKSLKIKY